MKKTPLLLVRFLFAAALLLAGVAAQAAAPLARAGNITVDKAEFSAYLDEVAGGGKGLSAEQKKSLLVKFLVRKSLAQQGEARGLGTDPQLVKGLFQWKVQNYPEFYWRKQAEKVKVSDKELRAHVNPQEEFLLSAIVFGLDDHGRVEAQEVAGQLAIGGDFAQLARERSLGLSAAAGGDFGWNPVPNKYVEAKEGAIIRATKVGGYTPPIETGIGWVIFWVRGRKSADEIFADLKEKVRGELLPPRIDAERARKLAELRAAAVITYPAEKAIPGAAVPLALVDGYAFYPDNISAAEMQHDFAFKSVSTPKERLEKLIDAFLVIREVEKTGLNKDIGLRTRLSLKRIDLFSQLYIRAEADPRIGLTEEELRAEYKRFYVPEVYALQVIAGTDRRRIEEAAAKLAAGEPFDTVAERFNDVRFAKQKGVLGAGPIVDYEPAVQRAVAGLPDGGVSGVLGNGESGWIIVKRLGMQIFTPPPYEEVAQAIRTRLQVKKRADYLRDYVDRYRSRLKITIDDAQLNAL